MHLNELKDKKPQELLDYADSLGIENASGLKKQEIFFSILKKFAEKNEEIIGGCFRNYARWLWFP